MAVLSCMRSGLLTLMLALVVGVAAAGGLGLRVRDAPAGGGAEVADVTVDSIAARAGLQPGDLIREASGRPISSASELAGILRSLTAGQPVQLVVERAGWRRQLSLGVDNVSLPSGPSLTPRLGLRLADQAPEADNPAAARVTAVEPGSPAADAGLAVGDLILEAQGRKIGGAADVVALINSLDRTASLELRISRDGWRRTLRLAPGQAAPIVSARDLPRILELSPLASAKAACSHGRLGIQLRESEDNVGVDIVEVEPDGAAASKLRRGDRITAIDGRPVLRPADLVALVDASLPGQRMKLALERDRVSMSLELRSGAMSDYDCLLERGDQQMDAKQWEEAARLYTEALRLQPKRLAAWESMAQLNDRKGDLNGAIESERRALAAVGETAAIHARISWYQQQLGLADDARVSAEQAIRLEPDNAAGHYTLASLAFSRLDWNEAIPHLRKYLEQAPNDAHAWGDLGIALANIGRDEESMEANRRSLKLDPDNAAIQFNAGLNLLRQGREQEAQAHLRRAVDLDSQGEIGQMARERIAPQTTNPGTTGTVDSVAARSDGRRASVAVGSFQVKAAKASQQIGDGLREMFLTSLYESGYFNVLERMDIQGIVAEQSLSRSGMAGPDSAMTGSQMDVADIMIYGVVSEFEPEAGGMAYSNFLPQMGMSVRQSTKFSEMAIDVRAVEVSTGRVLVAQRIPGTAQAYSAGLGARISAGGLSMPVGLGAYRNTPMEFAIRDCIQKATYFVINQVPQEYFRHP